MSAADIQTVTVGTNSGPDPVKFKQEENSSLKTLLYAKTEDFNKAIPQKDPVEEKRQDSEGEEPGCSATAKSVMSKDRPNRYPRKNRLQPTYTCSVCGRKFTKHYTLIRHIRSTHNKERPHRCSVCQKGFFRKYDYNRHMKMHMGELPFRCSVCNKAFSRRSRLTEHMRIHTGEKPFSLHLSSTASSDNPIHYMIMYKSKKI
uniref:C2H2-type domain-containing protein n=1 Tax=Neogobius melanostomus TaxID=47308 RepID=A0A8C6TI21_9GOBI